MKNINQLTIENSVIALIDHQPFVAFPIQSITATELINNVTALAKVAKQLEIPTILSTINAKGGPLNDPLFILIIQLQNIKSYILLSLKMAKGYLLLSNMLWQI